jgi:8-oxo-dGTP pyrophosphatase MutT (NUDIX family)
MIEAATVVLVRPVGGSGDRVAGGVETLMLRKNSGQSFGGAWVFPGGRVEPADGEGPESARRAAVREAFEETGLVIEAGELLPLSHWIPPDNAPKRFSTWFFLAALPPGASDVVIDGGEIGDQMWTTAEGALARHGAGEIEVLPPTWVTLHWLTKATSVEAALAMARAATVERFATHMAVEDDVLVSLWEPDPAWTSGVLADEGPRHRLYMTPGGWRYERTVDGQV